MMQHLPAALSKLSEYRQFVAWKIENGKKIPFNPITQKNVSVNDIDQFLTADEVLRTGNNLGFVFNENDPFFFLDIDKCLDGGKWSELSIKLMGMFPGAAVEVSQSNTGLHVIGKARTIKHACKNVPLGIELYTKERFVALTGKNIIGNADNTFDLTDVVDEYFAPREIDDGIGWTNNSCDAWHGPTDDNDLIEKAFKSGGGAGNVFGGKLTFKQLWTCDIEALRGAYPHDHKQYDASSADASLAQHLAFWTGNNCERIRNLMNRSGLVRDKWKRDDYLIRTIKRACAMQKTFYNVQSVQPKNTFIREPIRREGYQFLSVDGQIELFKGCIYVQDMHRVFTPDGTMLKSEQFNATYGGYVFQLEDNASGKSTRKAWEAFTESQAIQYPIAHSFCFRPSLDTGSLIEEEGHILVNTYLPINTNKTQGDVTPFINHLNKVLPNESDRDILLSYMAACIQYKGVKFQWCPLIQGTEGNGKTLFTRCVSYAIGNRYTHYPKASDIDNKFNGWLVNKLFIGIEDIYVPAHRSEILETLKPMITNDRIEVQSKGSDQITTDNCANFMINTNHKDALKKTEDDRRFAVFYTAQQSADDVKKSGMTGNYFPNLYDWLKSGGYQCVAHYLESYQIPDELNPATSCHRAPRTSSTLEAIAFTLGPIEQEIAEAIAQGQPGFAGGWVSSMAIDKLLNQIKANGKVPPNKRRDMMLRLGYDYHPALKNGRVNNYVAFDDGKPRLYIKQGHIHSNLTTCPQVVEHYVSAQNTASTEQLTSVFTSK